MYPIYRFINSHPYQRNQVPYNPYYCPHLESNPHNMNIDPSRSSFAYGSLPCGGNYGYPYPPQCHSCCIHDNSPNHCPFRPPHPYIPPPPYSNPAYPGVYPAHFVPPPHFTMEQPRYEYDKNMEGGHHCCGYPNRPCYKKGGSNVKIEEQDQDKKNEGNESLVPFGFKNSPFPVVWLPPDYMKNSEPMKPTGSTTGSKGKEQEEDSQVRKAYDDFRFFEQPKVWNFWPPYHGNNSESPTQRGDSTRKKQQDDVNKEQFPFPIIWMPYKPEETEGKICKETDSGNSVEQEPTSPSKSTIPRLHDAKDERSNSTENEVNSGSETHRKGPKKDSVLKTIPVKQVGQNEKVLDEKKEDASKRHDGDAKDAKEKKVIHEAGEKQSSSPKKSSKLPPVCLRVDPLPRKRSSNGTSRSPSPPGGKGKLVESCSDCSKPPILLNENVQLEKSLATNVPEKSVEVDPSKSKTKFVEVARGTSKEDKPQDQRSASPALKGQSRDQNAVDDANTTANEPKSQPDGLAPKAQASNEGHQSGEAREAAKEKEDAVDDMEKYMREKLSDEKAATMIQSAYRGFNVRRWEPLNKLKQIAKIKEQMAELKNHIQAMESSTDNGVDNKQRTIITEAIMGLLLKLDTVQGLHPTVRESRKSVAKELVSLQEKLDLMNCKKSEHAFIGKASEDTCRMVEENVHLRGCPEVQKLEQDDDLAEVDEGVKTDVKETSNDQPLCVTDMLSNTHHVGSREVPVGKEENKNNEDVRENFSSGSAVETRDAASELPSESKENAKDKLLDENEGVVEKSEEHDKSAVQNPIPFADELIVNSGSEVRGCGLKETGEDVNELEELPRGVLDEETSIQRSTEIRKDDVLQYDDGGLTVHIPEAKVSDTEMLEQHHMEALAETPFSLGAENNGSIKEENSEVLEIDERVSVDVSEKEIKEAGLLNEDGKIANVDDKVDMVKKGEEVEQCSPISDVISIQSPEEANTMKHTTDSIDTEETKTVEVLQEKMQNVVDRDIEILDSGKSIEVSAEPQLFFNTDDGVKEYHAADKQKVWEENMAVQGEEFLDHNDAVVSAPNDDGKEYNVEVEQKLVEENFEMQGEESVSADNAASVTEEPVNRNRTLASPTSEAATAETELLVEKEVDVAEDHDHSFSSIPTEVQVADTKEQKEWQKVDVSPSSPTTSQLSFESDASDRKLIEENEKLREMMEKLIEAGKEQLTAISGLSGRVKDLEKRLSRKKKLKLKRSRASSAGSACGKPSNDPLKDRAVGLAM